MSIIDKIQELKQKHNTIKNTYKMFPVGTKVQIITVAQDFNFFSGTETGVVVKNPERYLGIIVKFDVPRHFENGYIQTKFGFDPSDLIVLKKSESSFETSILAI